MLERFAPVSSGPTFPPTPKSVWHCMHVRAKVARPLLASPLGPPRSISLVCADAGDAAYVRIGRRLYGLNEAADAAPPVSEVVRQIPVDPKDPGVGAWPADPTPLLEACESAPGGVASG